MGRAFTTRRDVTRRTIISRINDEFGIELYDDAFDGAVVVALIGQVARLVKAVDNGRPVYERSLAEVRSLLCLQLNLSKDAVHADTELAGLFPDEIRLKRVWGELRSLLGKSLPALEFSRWANRIGAVAAFCAALGMLIWFPFWLGRVHSVDLLRVAGEKGVAIITLAAMGAAALLAFQGSLWLVSLVAPRHVPNSCGTVKSLALCALAKARPDRGADGAKVWTRELVEARVFAIVADESNLPFPAVAMGTAQVTL